MTELFEIRDTTLDLNQVVTAVSDPAMGAISTFVGVVRDHNQGRPVTLLEYEAYKSMAEKQLRHIARDIQRQHPAAKLAAVHRVGRLEVGEAAVICAASAPHRDEAFSVCRLLIDRIKGEVPIWKREHGPDGPYWVGWEDARCHGHGGAHDHHGDQ